MSYSNSHTTNPDTMADRSEASTGLFPTQPDKNLAQHSDNLVNHSSINPSSVDYSSYAKPNPEYINMTDVMHIIDVQAKDIGTMLQHSADLPVHWVQDYDALEHCLDVLETCAWLALDTEFIKRDTYYPRLALVQINTGQAIYLIDAPQLDLSEFWVVLSEVPVMIWHACGEDLGIFYLLSDCPPLNNIFDTQIALSYLTGELQIGYQQALAEQLSIEISKEQSQSDWLLRPLSHEQEQYAIDDVRYLLALFVSVSQSLHERGQFSQVWEDCQMYAKELYEAQHMEDDAAYLSMADFRYNRQQLAVLQAVSAWRESLARATNKPRTYVLKKQTVRELIEQMPNSIKQLAQKTSIHRSILRLYGDELLQVMASAKTLTVDDQPANIIAPYRSKDKALTKAVKQAIHAYAQETSVPENVLMRKKWLKEVYELVALDKELKELPEGLQGWRRAWVVDTLIPTISQFQTQLRQGMGLSKEGLDISIDESSTSL